MPRRRAAPRLYLDGKRRQWIIRDGPRFIRTGCIESDRRGAETKLAAYLGQKHKPGGGPDPLIADVLLVYAQEHVPHIKTAKNTSYCIGSLARWWGDRTVSEINARSCRQYAETKSAGAARRDLEVLRSALRFYQRERGLGAVPPIVVPPKGEPRERWLTRREAAALLRAADHQHLRRFILLGLYTGTRSGAILRLTWDHVDLASGVLSRRAAGEVEDARKRTPRVRLGKRILSHLRRWRRLDPPGIRYLCHYEGRPVVRLRKSFSAAVRRAGLAGVIPHTLRHTRATWMMQQGVPIWEAAGSLGMTIAVLERIYGHHHPDWQKFAAEV
jgi:integrase